MPIPPISAVVSKNVAGYLNITANIKTNGIQTIQATS